MRCRKHFPNFVNAIMPRLSVLFAALLVSLIPSVSRAQTDTGQTFLEFQVERPVRVKTPVAPVYPVRLRNAKTEGLVLVQFIVDERGTAQMGSFKVLRSNDEAFTESVRRAVSAMSFHPAEIGSRKVKVLVQQPYQFSLSTR
jgi:protein TonB